MANGPVPHGSGPSIRATKAIVHALALTGMLSLSGCQPDPTETEIAGEIQGTTYHIKLVLDDPAVRATALRGEIEKTFRGKIPLTIVRLSSAGRRAFQDYKRAMKGLLD